MNLIITSKCNKKCNYCFALEYMNQAKAENSVMSLDVLKKHLSRISPATEIKILGGEPTVYPYFREMYQLLMDRKQKAMFITNLLCDDEIIDIFIEGFEKGYIVKFLINAAELDSSEEIMSKFVKNYNRLQEYLYQKNLETVMAVSLALDFRKSTNYYLEYFEKLISKLNKIERIRLGMAFPKNKAQKGTFEIINNTVLGDTFYAIAKKALANNIYPFVDCQLLPCIFDDKEKLKLFMTMIPGGSHFKCPGTPADILPDNTCFYCFPLIDQLKVDTSKYPSMEDVAEALRKKYQEALVSVDVPDKCNVCKFYRSKVCQGPCLSFYNPESF